MLIGHQNSRSLFLDALAQGRMHHAWLITGPRGIGKRRFADWAASTLLSAGANADMSEHAASTQALLDAGSHPDHRILQPPVEGKGSATESIIVEQIRSLAEFLHSFPAIAPWRTLIVDSIDDMNLNAANAFLKELEEPREQTVYFLVSHSPARLLPTIRSRCRTLRLFALSENDTRAVLQAQNPGLAGPELDALARIADGVPGAAMDFAGANLAGLEQDLDRVGAGGSAVDFAKSLQAKAAQPRLQALLTLVPRRLAAAARRNADPRLFDLYEEAQVLAREAIPLAYDRLQVAMALAAIVARMGRIQEN